MMTLIDDEIVDSSTPAVAGNPQISSRFSFVAQVTVLVLLIVAGVFGYGRWRTGSFELVWPWLMGQQMVFTPILLDLGTISANQILEKEIKVTNVSAIPLSLLGSQKSCGCIALDEFPIEIPAMSGRSLLLKITTGTKTGKFTHTIKFFLEGQSYSFIVVTVTGSVT